MGVVIDFITVRDALNTIASRFDGEDLNALCAFNERTTSAENVAQRIANSLMIELGAYETLYRVSVTEAPGCVAAYYPNDP
jgi:6-pyruvoyl-tetrahydropterin synthase